MMIQSGTGNVGVGATAGDAKLNVGGNGSAGTGIHAEGDDHGVYGTGATGVGGSGTTHGVWGSSPVEGGHFIATGGGGLGVNALAASPDGIGVEGRNMISQNVGRLGTEFAGVYGENAASGNYGRLGGMGESVYEGDCGIKSAGDLVVMNGAYRGNITSASGSDGAPFPRPAYNSGWVVIDADETVTLLHGLYGNVDDYFVDLTMKGPGGTGITNKYIGRDSEKWTTDDNILRRGFYWQELDSEYIKVYREPDDDTAGTVRIRIWTQ